MKLAPFEAMWLHTVAHAIDHASVAKLLFSSGSTLLLSMNPWKDGTALDLANG
jgi:hypothetical protein